MEDETGAEYFLHAPTALGPTTLFHWVVEAGSAAKTLYKAFNSIGEDAQVVLDDLPFVP